jgi:hypothetical protein
MRPLLSFLGGFAFNLAWVWALPEAALWISLLVVSSVAVLVELLLVLAEEQLWVWARSKLHIAADLWRVVAGTYGASSQSGSVTPIACVAAALAGWGVVTLVDQLANGELVARIVLLCVGGVLLVGLLAPACWHRGRGTTVALLAKQVAAARDDGEGLREFTLPLPSVVSPDGKGKLRFVLNV